MKKLLLLICCIYSIQSLSGQLSQFDGVYKLVDSKFCIGQSSPIFVTNDEELEIISEEPECGDDNYGIIEFISPHQTRRTFPVNPKNCNSKHESNRNYKNNTGYALKGNSLYYSDKGWSPQLCGKYVEYPCAYYSSEKWSLKKVGDSLIFKHRYKPGLFKRGHTITCKFEKIK